MITNEEDLNPAEQKSKTSDFVNGRELRDVESRSKSRSRSFSRGRKYYSRSRSKSYSPRRRYHARDDGREWHDKHAAGNYGSAGGLTGQGPRIDVMTKAPMTCRFWKNHTCNKGAEHCTYIHGYICQYDLACKKVGCQEVHIRTRKTFYGVCSYILDLHFILVGISFVTLNVKFNLIFI